VDASIAIAAKSFQTPPQGTMQWLIAHSDFPPIWPGPEEDSDIFTFLPLNAGMHSNRTEWDVEPPLSQTLLDEGAGILDCNFGLQSFTFADCISPEAQDGACYQKIRLVGPVRGTLIQYPYTDRDEWLGFSGPILDPIDPDFPAQDDPLTPTSAVYYDLPLGEELIVATDKLPSSTQQRAACFYFDKRPEDFPWYPLH
jgi:hypothetical protein